MAARMAALRSRPPGEVDSPPLAPAEAPFHVRQATPGYPRDPQPRFVPPGSPEYDQAIAVAVEHCRWCQAIGMSPQQVIDVFTRRVTNTNRPSWDHAVWLIAAEWHELPKGD